ncbi:retrovirus-related pol polyprotein from transposon 17.6 [Dermatophagoides farinae]|uniref:Retrovirus-related pol polyprotein from transposon 17.6 n=1 Tax=Dermatophagoides farinae TaxID=6954 RepID=A0A9D4P666_DERFA|nr:retrovirus-related pol polyprotein from transposon 17.6 [Dermatophagoides farinae]
MDDKKKQRALNAVETELLEIDFDEEKFESYNRKCQVLINYFSVTTTSNTERAIKYQRRALPTFNGDIIQFNLFFREFLRIVDGDPALRIDEKFFTLKSMLKDEPLRLVANLLETEDNYERAKDILKERYKPNGLIYFNCLVNNKPIRAFIDTGAEITCISKNLFDQLKLQIIKNSIINIRQLDNLTQSLGRVKINLQIGRITRCVEAHVVRNLTTNLLLGLDNSQLFDLSLDLNDNCLKQCDKIVNNVQHSSNQQEYHINQNLNENQRHCIREMINQYGDVFAQSKSDVGYINHQHHRIDLSNEMPIFLKPYRTSPREQKNHR